MNKTLVIQSHRSPLPFSWIAECLGSVRDWSNTNGFEYCFLGDELFDALPDRFLELKNKSLIIATDLARLYVLKNYLLQGYEQVVWLDADFLIFDPEKFILPASQYAFGREVWVQKDNSGKLRAYKKIHNAFMMFNKGNSFLDFYIETAERLLWKNTGSIPPQFIGPKLLTAMHNIALFPVMEEAGMLSPLVIKDIIKGTGAAHDMFVAQSHSEISGANLCISSCEHGELVENEIQHLIIRLRSGK